MKQRLFFVGIVLLLSSLLFACGGQSGEATAQQPSTPIVEFGTPVEVADVETGDITLIYSYNGSLQSKEDINLLPSVAGRVDAVLVEEGDKVKAGDPIATIDQDTYLVQLRQAEAALKSAELNLAKMRLGSRPEEIAVAQAGVEVARAALDDVATIDDDERTTAAAALARTEASLRSAQSEYDKIAWAGDVGTKPQAIALEQATIAYEDALADYNLRTTPSDSQLAPLIVQLAQAELNLILKQQPFREVDFAIAEAGVEQAQTAVDLVNLQLEDTTITVPFEGIIVDLPITEGSTVGPQSPVAFIVSEEVEVAIELEEGRINQISEGQSVSLQLSAYPDQTFPATVTSIDPIADANTRTFTVKITPVDEEGLLKSGMYADVSLLADERTNTVVVPREAIVQQDDQTLVYVIEQGIASQREVETGLSDGQKVEILSGLEPGETVVISGQPNLADGAKVEVVNRL
jgi:multidrug efflux pump subunit AcrA (membrane-fusion protein)